MPVIWLYALVWRYFLRFSARYSLYFAAPTPPPSAMEGIYQDIFVPTGGFETSNLIHNTLNMNNLVHQLTVISFAVLSSCALCPPSPISCVWNADLSTIHKAISSFRATQRGCDPNCGDTLVYRRPALSQTLRLAGHVLLGVHCALYTPPSFTLAHSICSYSQGSMDCGIYCDSGCCPCWICA